MDITVILPLHKYTEDYDSMLKNATESIKYTGKDKEVELMVVARKKDYEKYTNLDKKSVKFIEVLEDESTSFQHLVNKGAEACNTDYFSVLEVDDVFTDVAFDNFKKYNDGEFKSSIMLYLTELVDYSTKENGSIGYVNEAVWANGFSENLGFIDKAAIEDFFEFNLTGAIIKRDDFISVGKLKESFKLTFWYEFLMRALNCNLTAFVIPKVGYIHTIKRVDSLSDEYAKSLSQDEAEWWIDLAKKEYLYKDDRNKQYEE